MAEVGRIGRCPFCGGAGEIRKTQRSRDGFITGVVSVRCTNCKAQTRPAEYPVTDCTGGEPEAEAKVIRLWNRRVK